MGERLVCNQEVVGSNPIGSTRTNCGFQIGDFGFAQRARDACPTAQSEIANPKSEMDFCRVLWKVNSGKVASRNPPLYLFSGGR